MGGDLSNEVKMNNDALYHHGIKGMRWGVIRTPEQLGHKSKKKRAKDMTDDELRKAVNRMNLEKQYNSMINDKSVSIGKRFLKFATASIIAPLAAEMGKNLLREQIKNIKPGSVKAGYDFVQSVVRR